MCRKRKFTIVCLMILFTMLAGCRTVPEEPAPAGRAEIAIAAGKTLIEAIRTGNYKRFSGEFDRMTEDEFKLARQRLEEQFGIIESCEHLARMTTPGELENHVWRVSFVRVNRERRVIRQDVLFRIVSGNDDGHERILAMGFL